MAKAKLPAQSPQLQRAPMAAPTVAPRPATPRPMPLSRAAAPLQRATCACGGEIGADGQCAECRARAQRVQRKMTVNPPGDALEQEADQVARTHVQRQAADEKKNGAMAAMPVQRRADDEEMSAATVQRRAADEEMGGAAAMPVQRRMDDERKNGATAAMPVQRRMADDVSAAPDMRVQRQAADEDMAAPVQRQAADEERGDAMIALIQRAGAAPVPEVTPAVESGIQGARGGGSALPPAVQRSMEDTMGADLSGVRVHHDGRADQLSRQLDARAFTSGRDIFFRGGEYNPESGRGRELLAHEAAHTVQQGGGIQRGGVQRQPIQRQPRDEPKKHAVIDYESAKAANLASWYEQYKFYNLFHEERIYPGSSPIAYANHVYELQLKLEEMSGGKWWAEAQAGTLETKITGNSTLLRLAKVAEEYQKNPEAAQGISPAKLERIHKYFTAFEPAAPPLVSSYFRGVHQLEIVNRNQYFAIQFDDRGEYVERIQQALLSLNYDLDGDLKVEKGTKKKQVSGVFGRGTKQAVINFQKDSGLEGQAADGIIGQVTLRLLDKRIGAPAFEQQPSVAAGNAFAFHVPLAPADLKMGQEELKQLLLRRTLKLAFPVSDDDVEVMTKTWRWERYSEPTEAEAAQGFYKVTIAKSDYHSIIEAAKPSAGGAAGESVEEKLKGMTLDLLKTPKLIALNKKIEEVQQQIRIFSLSGNSKGLTQKLGELEQLKKEQQEELNRLGLTPDQYEKLKSDFINTFEAFAVQVAFQMLADNEIQVNIEAQHYGNKQEVVAVKAVMADLAQKYAASEALWWKAVSLEESKGTDDARYKSNADYTIQNTSYGHAEDIEGTFTGDPKRYYTEQNVSEMYKDEKSSSYFDAWKKKEEEVVTTLQGAAVPEGAQPGQKGAKQKYPILAYPKLQLRQKAWHYAAQSDDDLQKLFLGILQGSDGIKQNIAATRENLREDREKVWELPVVISRAQQLLGVTEGPPADLIKAKQKDVADTGFWKSIGMAVLGIGLGLLALVSGPVGWLALGASIGVGAYDAYKTYQEITFKKEAFGTAIDPAKALGTEDPSYFWFWVSLVTVGLDVFQAAKLVKAVGKGIDLAQGVTRGLEEAKAAARLKLAEAGEATAKGKELLKEIEEIDKALAKVSSVEFAENIKFLEPLKGNPMAVVVMKEALRDKKVVRAVTDLGKLLKSKELFEDALKFYAGIGRNSLDELPELLRLIKEGGLDANKRLMTELMFDPRVQRALLDSQDPKLIAREFEAWEAAAKAGQSQSFVKYLEAQNLTTRLAHDVKLADMFGEAFAALPNAVKNRQILRTVEPRLLDALNAKALSPELARGLDVLLNSEVLAQSSRLASAQERLLRELRLLGGLIETPADFSKMVSLLDNPTSRRALWEGATQLAGKSEYVELVMKVGGGKLPAGDVMDDLIRIGPVTDPDTVRTLINNKPLREALVKYPEAVAVLKKCASPCLPPFVTPEQVVRVAKTMVGKSNDDARRIREFLYLHRNTEAGFESALKNLETDFAAALKDIKTPVIKVPPKLKVAAETLQGLEAHLPASELNKIMTKAAAVPNGSAILTDLYRVLQLANNVKLQNFDTLIKGLAEGSAAEFRAARHLLDEAERFVKAADGFKYAGLQKADALLGRFTLTELGNLMNARWSGGFVNTLYGVVVKVDGGSNKQIADLIRRAGGGGDLGRLADILSFIKTPTATYDEAVKAIEAADAFAAGIAKAMRDPKAGFEATAKLIWGGAVKIEDGVIKATEALGKSGSDAYQAVFKLGQGKSIAEAIAGGGALNKERWKVFRSVIEKSDIAPAIKNSILGEMWTRVHVEYYEALGYKVFREVSLTAGGTTARADLILVKGKQIVVVECKSGGAAYSAGQEVIYGLLKDRKSKSVMLEGDEALADLFAKTEPGFIVRRESELIPPD